MLIMEIYSSLRRKNVKSKDSRYHHLNIESYATVLFLHLFIYIIPKICHSVWYHYTVTFLCMHMRLLTVVVCILTSLGMPRQGRYLKRLEAKT